MTELQAIRHQTVDTTWTRKHSQTSTLPSTNRRHKLVADTSDRPLTG